MKISLIKPNRNENGSIHFLKLIMKTLIFFYCALALALGNESGFAQDKFINLPKNKTLTIEKAFELIDQQSEYKFIYRSDLVKNAPKITFHQEKIKISDLLNRFLDPIGFTYDFSDGKTVVVNRKIEVNKTKNQQQLITGKVIDAKGFPLSGATIIEKGTKNGVISNFDGDFSISVSNPDAVLVVTFLGFADRELPLQGKTNLTIVLQESTSQLDEVVVVGYGTVRKRDVTGAVSNVKVDEEVARQYNTVDQLLQGRVAGVQVTQNTGSPGSGVSVQIRGRNSLRGNNEPLYVIDGVIIASAGEDAENAGGVQNIRQDTQNGLNGINPRDIESIEILKDASATAIYGSRGANGVVLITTKNGKSGKTNINGFLTTGVRTVMKTYDMLEGLEYAQYRNESAELLGNPAPYHIENGQVYGINVIEDTINEDPSEIHNWQDELFNDLSTNLNVGASISGGNTNGDYYVSFGYNDQNGLTDNARFQSGDFRLNLNQQLSNRLKLEARLSGFYSKSGFGETGDRAGDRSFVWQTLVFNPIVTSGLSSLYEDLEQANPYAWVEDFEDISKENRYIGSIAFKYDIPVEGLEYELKLGGNFRNKDRRRFWGLTTWQGANSNGALTMSDLDVKTYQINNLLKYNRTFNNKHRFNAVLGTTYDVRKVRNAVYAVENFITPIFGVDQPSLGQTVTKPMSIIYADQQIMSFLGRINYTFNDKYVVTASVRTDGVSKFSKENRYSTFPSFALAWRADNEDFIKNINFFNELKFRAGWGQIGNHGIGPYGTLPNLVGGFSPDSYYATPSEANSIPILLNNIPSPDLKWETTEQINLGVDFAFLKNRISGTFDWYEKETRDLLQNVSIPPSSGYSKLVINRGAIFNKGIELSLNGTIVDTEDVKLTIGGNIAHNKGRIKQLGIPLSDLAVDGQIQQRSFYFGDNISNGGYYFRFPANIFVEGEEIALFYGFQTDGIYQTEDTDILEGYQPGDIRYVDQNNDGIINNDDRTFIGNPNPDFTYGINMALNYKRFSASLLFNGVQGNDIVNGHSAPIGMAEGLTSNISTDAYRYAWRPDAQSNQYPRINSSFSNPGGAMTDRIVEDGSYFRLSNVTVGYEIPNIFNRLYLYLSAQNLFTITDYSGFSPEVTSFMYNPLITGVDWNSYPDARNFLIGIDINF